MSEAINKYNQKKEFITILQLLFSKIDDLATDDRINSNEYNEFAMLCKELRFAKQQIKETIIYVNLRRATERKPPKEPIKETEKLNNQDYNKCPHCDKLIHKNYINEHMENTIQCFRQRQTKKSMINVKEINKKYYNDNYGIYQALNLSLKHKNVNFQDLYLTNKLLQILQIKNKDELI